MTLVQEFLETSAKQQPDKVFVVCGERRVTYAQLDAMANRVANGMARNGVTRGDRVVICMDNSVEATAAIFATSKAGAIFSVINPATKVDKLAYVLNDLGASVVICDGKSLETALDAADASQTARTVICASSAPKASPEYAGTLLAWNDLATQESDAPPLNSCIDVDLATIIYTSASTGAPKGVMSTHLNVVTAANSITQYLENTPDDVILNLLPLAFDYGLYQLLMAAKLGATLVLERSFAFPYRVVELLEREHVTGFPGVPTIFAILLQMKDLDKHEFPSLRYISSTGAPLPTAHIRRLRQVFPHSKLYSMYGLTECKRVSYLPPEELDQRPDSVGKAIPNTEAYVVDEHGQRVPSGVVGELVVRGAHVTRGYWRDSISTSRAFRPGPCPGETILYTGDLFRTDEDGFLYFVGRADDIIKSRGKKISPKEVEDVLYALPDIGEAAVFGISDPVLGQAVKAVVVPRAGASLDVREIIVHCKSNLEDAMVPKYVEVRSSLPKTRTGKIDKKELR